MYSLRRLPSDQSLSRVSSSSYRCILPSGVCFSSKLSSPSIPHPHFLFPLALLFLDLYISCSARTVIRQYTRCSETQVCRLVVQAPEELLFAIKVCLGICDGQHGAHKKSKGWKLKEASRCWSWTLLLGNALRILIKTIFAFIHCQPQAMTPPRPQHQLNRS